MISGHLLECQIASEPRPQKQTTGVCAWSGCSQFFTNRNCNLVKAASVRNHISCPAIRTAAFCIWNRCVCVLQVETLRPCAARNWVNGPERYEGNRRTSRKLAHTASSATCYDGLANKYRRVTEYRWATGG